VNHDQQRRWQPTIGQVLWIVGIVVALVVLLHVGYALQWTGFGQSKVAQDVRPARTLWDWLKLLIVPAVLGAGGYYLASFFTRTQNQATQVAAEQQAQDEALQAYLGQMSEMLIPNGDQPSLSDERPPDRLKTVARARTLTLLPRLDADRKARVVQFLYESGLVTKPSAVLDLKGADLSVANLHKASLERTDLRSANLNGANLRGADLSSARLDLANLQGASLSQARGWTEEKLDEAESLTVATMPDGLEYEDWREVKEGRKERPDDEWNGW
jgi:hypothetical protein